MTIRQWIELAATLDIDGLEFYTGFLELADKQTWKLSRQIAADHNLAIPMLCCSPDFTHPDPAFRREQVDHEKRWIDMTAELGGKYCRVLSGQRRPELSREAGLSYAAECITACLDHAASCGVTLILENHYKDNYWDHPEFAQSTDMFLRVSFTDTFASLRRQLRSEQRVLSWRRSAGAPRACERPRCHDACERSIFARRDIGGPPSGRRPARICVAIATWCHWWRLE